MTFSCQADFAPGEGGVHFILLQTEPVRGALVGHFGLKLGIL